MENFSKISIKVRILIVSLGVLLVVFALDRLIFDLLFWRLKNPYEWGEGPWFTFLKETRQVEATQGKNNVLIVGSSVALYSALPDLLNSQNENLQSRFFAHVAMAPSDTIYYLDKILENKPDTVVYFFNIADMQWEYFPIIEGRTTFFEKNYYEDFANRYPAKVIYPLSFLKDHWNRISKKSILSLISKSILLGNRYRPFFLDTIEEVLKEDRRHSFETYLGPMPKEGIWKKGYLRISANLNCEDRSLKNSDIYSEDGEQIRIKIPQKNIDKVVDLPKGWTPIVEVFPEILPYETEKFELAIEPLNLKSTKGNDSFPQGIKGEYGPRLSHFFCRSKTQGSSNRKPYWEDARLEKMSKVEYREDYFLRFEKDRYEKYPLLRMNVIRDRKMALPEVNFSSNYELDKGISFVRSLSAKKIRVILILSPDNPIETEFYLHTIWYKNFVDYLRSQTEPFGIEFIDWTNQIPDANQFLDPHHLTYYGAEKLTIELKKVLEKKNE